VLASVVFSGCGGGSPPETCIQQQVSYSGAAAGPSFFKASSTDGSLLLTQASASITALEQTLNGLYFCWNGGSGDLDVNVRVWIDKSGAASTTCADVAAASCEPAQSDPQGHRAVVVPFGKVTTIPVLIVDP